jgi:hypothetical protein
MTNDSLLGTFTKLRKRLSASLCLSIFLSVRQSTWNNSAPAGQIFVKFLVGDFNYKTVEKIQVWFKSDESFGNFTWRPQYVCDNITLNYSRNKKGLD